MFSLKGNKFITHVKRLKDPREPLGSFLGSGLLRLREKLGPILWQLPPLMTFDEERLRTFVSILPHDAWSLAAFAAKHSSLDAERMDLQVDENRPVRHAIEFRNESFVTPRFVDILREHNVAMVIADEASKFPSGDDVTADWVYIRLHGERVGRESGYTPEEIKAWAAKARVYAAGGEPAGARRIGGPARPAGGGRDVFIAFDNTEIKRRSPVNARQMSEELGVAPPGSVSEVLAELGAKVADSGASNGSASSRKSAATAPKKTVVARAANGAKKSATPATAKKKTKKKSKRSASPR